MFWQNIHEFDQMVTLAINGSIDCNFFDQIMIFFSKIPVWIPMYVIIAVMLIVRLGWKKGLISIAAIALCFLICDQVANLFKNGIQRPRPGHSEFMVAEGLRLLMGKGSAYGFFSGHAANSFGFAVSTSMAFRMDKRLKYRGYCAWIFFWAAMVSISRVFVGKHYAGDVLVGIIFGILAGLACGYLARWVVKRLLPEE